MKLLRGDLRQDRNDKSDRENSGANQIAQMHRHRNRVPAGLPQRGRGNLDDPEDQRDLRNLAQALLLPPRPLRCLPRQFSNLRRIEEPPESLRMSSAAVNKLSGRRADSKCPRSPFTSPPPRSAQCSRPCPPAFPSGQSSRGSQSDSPSAPRPLPASARPSASAPAPA